jgi:hypothetical protein
MMVNRLTTGQLSYEAYNDVAAPFGVTTIPWPLATFVLAFLRRSAASDRPTLTSLLN